MSGLIRRSGSDGSDGSDGGLPAGSISGMRAWASAGHGRSVSLLGSGSSFPRNRAPNVPRTRAAASRAAGWTPGGSAATYEARASLEVGGTSVGAAGVGGEGSWTCRGTGQKNSDSQRTDDDTD